jgi:hypothetical protein
MWMHAQHRVLVLQCVFDDGRPEHRVCKFHNLLIYESNIHYIYSGTPCLELVW